MKRKNKGVKAYSLGGLILLVLIVVVLVGCGALSVSLPKCADNDGAAVSKVYNSGYTPAPDELDVSTSENSYYYLNLPLNGLNFYPYQVSGKKHLNEFTNPIMFNRTTCTATVVMRFNNVKHSDKSVLVTFNTVINVPARGATVNNNFWFTEEVNVNIRSTYYDVLEKNKTNFSSVKFTLYFDGYAFPCAVKSGGDVNFTVSGINVFTSPDLIPGDDGFGDDGGLNGDPITPNGFFDWFNRQAMWVKVVIGVLCFIVVLFVIGVIIKLFKWIFN